jgi:hypothetical protein
VAGVAEAMLDVDVAEAALAGWRQHEELLAAARATAASRGRSETVDLSGHDVVGVWEPIVEVRLGDAPVARLVARLRLTLSVVGLSATVAGGRLTGLRAGRCEATALLALSGRPLLERTVPVSPGVLALRLGRGVPLLRDDPGAAA